MKTDTIPIQLSTVKNYLIILKPKKNTILSLRLRLGIALCRINWNIYFNENLVIFFFFSLFALLQPKILFNFLNGTQIEFFFFLLTFYIRYKVTYDTNINRKHLNLIYSNIFPFSFFLFLLLFGLNSRFRRSYLYSSNNNKTIVDAN